MITLNITHTHQLKEVKLISCMFRLSKTSSQRLTTKTVSLFLNIMYSME